MAITYCNTTTDLLNVYSDIVKYQGHYELDSNDWVNHSGIVYKMYNTGHVDDLFEDGQSLTEADSIANVDESGEWYYDDDTDVLYVQCSDDTDPSLHTMETGRTWGGTGGFLETVRNNAQEILEGYLRPLGYIVPLRPIVAPKESYNSRDYDYWVIRSTAIITCALIVENLNPGDQMASKLWKMFDNPDPDVDESPGMLQRLKDGDYALKIQRATTEPGHFNIYENSNNTATAYFDVTGRYNGSHEVIWRLQIDGAGAPGTATYKLSKDGGTTFDITTQDTWEADGDIKRIHIGQGIYVRFVGTFEVGDYIDIHAYPDTDVPQGSKFSYIKMER